MKNTLLKWLVTRTPLLTLLVMLISAGMFGLVSYDLFYFLKLNIELVRDFGAQALHEGAFAELVQLVGEGVLSLLFYIVFKACEKTLVEWLLR